MAKEVFNSQKEDDYKKRVEELDEKQRHLDFMLDALKQNENIPEAAQTDLEKDLSLDDYFDDNVTTFVIRSKNYKGRHAAVLQSKNKSLNLIQYSDHLFKSAGKEYKPIDLNLSPETFILLLENMLFSAKILNIDTSEIIKKLTEGRDSNEIEFTVRECKIVS